MTEVFIILMNCSAAACALVAAYFWFQSSVVKIYADDIPPEQKELNAFKIGSHRGGFSVAGTMNAAAKLNSKAAIWAAVSAVSVALSLAPAVIKELIALSAYWN